MTEEDRSKVSPPADRDTVDVDAQPIAQKRIKFKFAPLVRAIPGLQASTR